MRAKPSGEYPENWKEIATRTKQEANWKCIRCKHDNDIKSGHVLTVHHFTGEKNQCSWWNCLALCQRCHLKIQGTVNPNVPYMYEHSDWMKVYVSGFYCKKYLSLDISRKCAITLLNELSEIEQHILNGDINERDSYLSTLRKRIRDVEGMA